jgi:phosphohistidine phosphatase SixA
MMTRVISDVRRRDHIWKGENMMRAWTIVAVTLGLVGLSKNHALGNELALWEALRSGGHVALLRHAIAPGTGDPAAFTIGDCSTQRNLSDRGRAQADRIGRRFRANDIETARVFSSQWCRCRDTAELLKLGPVSELSALNSFFQRSENRKPQTQTLKAWLTEQDLGRMHVLVTHQVNITELTGVYPSSGELVIVRPSRSGDVTVIGTIETD